MLGGRYGEALGTVLRGAAVPYGYTATIWGSGAVLIHHRGSPTVVEIFLFVLGATAAAPWPLGSFVGTAAFLLVASLDMGLALARRTRRGAN